MAHGLLASDVLRGISDLLKSALLEPAFSVAESTISTTSSAATINAKRSSGSVRRPHNPAITSGARTQHSIESSGRTANSPVEMVSSQTTFDEPRASNDANTSKEPFFNEFQHQMPRSETKARTRAKTPYMSDKYGPVGDGAVRKSLFSNENQDNLLRNETNARTNAKAVYSSGMYGPVGDGSTRKPLFANENQDNLQRHVSNVRTDTNSAYTFSKSGLTRDGSIQKCSFVDEDQDSMLRNKANVRPNTNTACTCDKSGIVGDHGSIQKSSFVNESQYELRNNMNATSGNITYIVVKSGSVGDGTKGESSFINENETNAKTSYTSKKSDPFGHRSVRESLRVDENKHHFSRTEERNARTNVKIPHCCERPSPKRDVSVVEPTLQSGSNRQCPRTNEAIARTDMHASNGFQHSSCTGSISIQTPNENRNDGTGSNSRIRRTDAQTSSHIERSGCAGNGSTVQNPWLPSDYRRNGPKRKTRASRKTSVQSKRHQPYGTTQRKVARNTQSFSVYRLFWQKWAERFTKEVCSSYKMCNSCNGRDDAVFESRQWLYKREINGGVVVKKFDLPNMCHRTVGEQFTREGESLTVDGLFACVPWPADIRRETVDTREQHCAEQEEPFACKQAPQDCHGRLKECEVADNDSNESVCSNWSGEHRTVVHVHMPPCTPRILCSTKNEVITTVRESAFNCCPRQEKINVKQESECCVCSKCAADEHDSTIESPLARSRVEDRSGHTCELQCKRNQSRQRLDDITVAEFEQHSPYVGIPRWSREDEHSSVYCHPVWPRRDGKRVDVGSISTFSPQQTNPKTNEMVGVETVVNNSTAPCSHGKTEGPEAAKTPSLEPPPSHVWQDEGVIVAVEVDVSGRLRQNWIKNKGNLNFKHSSSRCSSWHSFFFQPLDEELNSFLFPLEENKDSSKDATKCESAGDERASSDESKQSIQRRAKEKAEQATQPPPLPQPLATRNEEESAYKQKSPQRCSRGEQLASTGSKCSTGAEPRENKDRGRQPTEDTRFNEHSRLETAYRKHTADRAKRHIDALFNSRRAEEITNQLILHHMDVNATMDVFFGCMEFFWTQLGDMLADVPLPSSRDE